MLHVDRLPDLRKLYYVREALRHGSLRRAAHALGVTQPALSRQLQDLEELFGVTLMQRDTTGSRCTEAGAIALEKIDGLLDAVSEMSAMLADLSARPAGLMTVAMPSSCTMPFLPPIIAIFERKYPGVSIRVMEGSTRHIQEWVIGKHADIGIVVAPSGSSALLEEVVLREELLLYGPPGLERRKLWRIADVAQLRLVVPLPPYGTRRIIDALARAEGVKLQPHLEVDNPLTIRNLVLSGGFHTIASPLIFLGDADAGATAGRVAGKPSRSLAIATLKGASLSGAARAFATEMRRIMREHARVGQPPDENSEPSIQPGGEP